MSLSLGMITVNTTDAITLARWWAAQTGGEIRQENDGWYVIVALPGGPYLSFQKVDDPTPGRNRIHLDLIAPELDAEVDRLVIAGATRVADRNLGDFRWTVLTDPDGNEFCVAGGPEPGLNEVS